MISFEGYLFDWDAGNSAKCCKHGVSVSEIEAVFQNDPGIVPDLEHSIAEERLVAIGLGVAGRPVFIAFTIRSRDGKQFIRPVTARYMHKKELLRYAKAGTKIDD